jgi:glycosyltransferase involved in cell wall biosynthesis
LKGKLLLVINHLDWFWSHRLPLAQAAQSSGWQVVVAAPRADEDRDLLRNGFLPASLPAGSSPITLGATIVALRSQIRQQQPDLVHAVTLKCALLTGLATVGMKPSAAVCTIAGLGWLYRGDGWRPRALRAFAHPIVRFALRRRDVQLIFQNGDDMELLVGAGAARARQSCVIPGSGVDLEKFRYRPEPEVDAPLVLMATRLVREKGIHVFVEAARILAGRGVNIRFALAGGRVDGNPGALSIQEVESLTRHSGVRWLGRVTDMPQLIERCAVVAYPSWYGEGVPKILLEAAACGRPIVTTDHPGCREVVAHGENGLLVPIRDPQATADAIARLIADPDLRVAMGLRGRRIAVERFGVDMIVAATLAVYQKAMLQHAGQHSFLMTQLGGPVSRLIGPLRNRRARRPVGPGRRSPDRTRIS